MSTNDNGNNSDQARRAPNAPRPRIDPLEHLISAKRTEPTESVKLLGHVNGHFVHVELGSLGLPKDGQAVSVTALEQAIADSNKDSTERTNQLSQRLADLAQRVDEELTYDSDAEDSHLVTEVTPDDSVAIGLGALLGGALERDNVAIGKSAGEALDGGNNVAIGAHALYAIDGLVDSCVAIGENALANHLGNLRNVTAIGANTRATGHNQVVLGDVDTNLTLHSAAQVRADVRDMHEPVPCDLGLDFVNRLQVVQYRQDFRERYCDHSTRPVPPEPLRPAPKPPTLPSWHANYQGECRIYTIQLAQWKRDFADHQNAVMNYQIELAAWYRRQSVSQIKADGTHAGKRPHYAITGQSLHALSKALGEDIGIFQLHNVDGGEPVYSYAPEELVPVLINCIQQLTAEMRSNSFVDRIASALIERHGDSIRALVEHKQPPSE